MKPNEPIKNPGCKSGRCKPTVQIKQSESWLNRQPVIAKVEIPETPKTIDGRCECLSSPSPWEPVEAWKGISQAKEELLFDSWNEVKRLRIWKWIAIILLLAFATMTFLLSEKINLLNEVIDFQQEILRELGKSELPQGNGEIETPGVLPPKGWIDPKTII